MPMVAQTAQWSVGCLLSALAGAGASLVAQASNDIPALPRIGDAGQQVPALYVALGTMIILVSLGIGLMWKLVSTQRDDVKQRENNHDRLSDKMSDMSDRCHQHCLEMMRLATESSARLATSSEKCSMAAERCAEALERCTERESESE